MNQTISKGMRFDGLNQIISEGLRFDGLNQIIFKALRFAVQKLLKRFEGSLNGLNIYPWEKAEKRKRRAAVGAGH